MRPSTLRRADVVQQQQAVDDVLEGLDQLRKKNEASMCDVLPQLAFADYSVSLFSKGANSSVTKITQLTQSDISNREVDVHRNGPRSERTPSPTYLFRIEYLQILSTARCAVGHDCEGACGSDSGARGGVRCRSSGWKACRWGYEGCKRRVVDWRVDPPCAGGRAT